MGSGELDGFIIIYYEYIYVYIPGIYYIYQVYIIYTCFPTQRNLVNDNHPNKDMVWLGWLGGRDGGVVVVLLEDGWLRLGCGLRVVG